MSGINYPWSSYGCDFGLNVWGGHVGVTTHLDEVRHDFETMASIGLEVVRWFVFTDGRGGVQWNGSGAVGLAPAFFDDMDAALEVARGAGVRLCLVLFDYTWMVGGEQRDQDGALVFKARPELMSASSGRGQIIEALIDPLLDRYGTGGDKASLGEAIHSIDVMNEPDWVTRGMAAGRLRAPLSRKALGALVGAIADRVHAQTRALVTVGGGRVRLASEWSDPVYGLDFIQVHSYPDRRHPRRDTMLIGRSCASLGLSKPVLIGECPANGDRQHPPDHSPPAFTLEDYVSLAQEGGYLGVWPWSFKGVDDFGAVDAAAFRDLLARR